MTVLLGAQQRVTAGRVNTEAQAPISSRWAPPVPAAGQVVPSVPAEIRNAVVACQSVDLSALAAGVERDTWIDIEHGLLQVWVDSPAAPGGQVTFVVDYLNDPMCAADPRLSGVIDHAFTTAMESIRMECPSLRALLAAGSPRDAKGRTIDRASLGRHVNQWCAGG